ncbi:MAG: T9SS type A sorting domain-containing protein [Ignavibacteria bacterium]|nr:T9SS type A sorting domain-containing protein [Ignavibacteria bacterium]
MEFAIPKDNFVSLKIYNLLGKEIMSLVNEFKQAGSYIVTFDAANYPSGVYYYKIKTGSHSGAGSFVQVKKMILIK